MSVGGGGERVEEGIDLARFKLIQTATQARMNMKPDFTLDYGLGMEALLLVECHFCLRFLRSSRMSSVSSACSTADSCKFISLRSTEGIVVLFFLAMSRG
jgi:hypothetical protein